MPTAYVVTALVTIAFNTFSGFAAMTRFAPITRTLGPRSPEPALPES